MFLADLKNHDPEFERVSHQTIPFIKFNSCHASYVWVDNSFIYKENAKEDQVTWKVMISLNVLSMHITIQTAFMLYLSALLNILN